MAALLTATPQNIAPPRSLHTNAEAVRFRAATAVRLISTFQDAMLPAWISKVEPLRYLVRTS